MSGWEVWVVPTKDNQFPQCREDRPLFPRQTYKLKRQAQAEATTLNKVPWKKPQWTYEVRKVAQLTTTIAQCGTIAFERGSKKDK